MPYLAMIDRLRAFLKQPTATLIVCGYSFRDEHINEVIVQGLQSTQTTVAFALLFDDLTTYSQAAALALRRSNLNILARDGAVIGGQEAEWGEREAESVSPGNGSGVRWTPVDPKDEKGRWSAEFTLGDFAVFGQFLQELVGTVRQTTAVPNAQ